MKAEDFELEELEREIEKIETNYRPPSEKEARWFFDYQRFIWELRAKLMGGYITQDKDGFYKIMRFKGCKGLLNKQGVEDIVSLVNGFVTDKIHPLSIFTEERILQLCRDLYTKLAIMLYKNMEFYEIDPGKASVILRMVMNLFEANLRKAIGGMSLRMLGQTEKVIEQKTEPKKRFPI